MDWCQASLDFCNLCLSGPRYLVHVWIPALWLQTNKVSVSSGVKCQSGSDAALRYEEHEAVVVTVTTP